MNITVSAYSFDGYGVWLPRLSHTRMTNQLDVQLDNLTTNSGFSRSRFGLEVVVAGRSAIHNLTTDVSWTIDDKYTPGVFSVRSCHFEFFGFRLQLCSLQTDELVMSPPAGNSTHHRTFFQWRPVVYTTSERLQSSSTYASVSVATSVAPNDVVNTMLNAFYGEDLEDMLLVAFNVTFGKPKDGYYKKTKYHAW